MFTIILAISETTITNNLKTDFKELQYLPTYGMHMHIILYTRTNNYYTLSYVLHSLQDEKRIILVQCSYTLYLSYILFYNVIL